MAATDTLTARSASGRDLHFHETRTHIAPVCRNCGWIGHLTPTRTAEGFTLAERDAADHKCGDHDPFRTLHASLRASLGLPA
jgi:hypothetical protein